MKILKTCKTNNFDKIAQSAILLTFLIFFSIDTINFLKPSPIMDWSWKISRMLFYCLSISYSFTLGLRGNFEYIKIIIIPLLLGNAGMLFFFTLYRFDTVFFTSIFYFLIWSFSFSLGYICVPKIELKKKLSALIFIFGLIIVVVLFVLFIIYLLSDKGLVY